MDRSATHPRTYEIGRHDFGRFRHLIHDACGISLGESKDALLTARIARRMRELGTDSHGAYYELIVADTTGAELQCLLDAVSTNVTSFFREPEHFAILGSHLGRRAAAGANELRLWSAACATGEEPYSMAMVAASAVPAACRVRILATDISTEALATACAGRYAAERVAKVPREYASRHLAAAAGAHQVSQALRSMVTFSPINLSRPPFPMRGPFDVVFCRNVMIYFDRDTRQRLIRDIERLLAPGGLLMLGHAESLAGIACSMKAVAPAVYEKVGT